MMASYGLFLLKTPEISSFFVSQPLETGRQPEDDNKWTITNIIIIIIIIIIISICYYFIQYEL